MAVLKLAAFSGEQPRVISRMLPDNSAQAAVNSRLDNGGLGPMRESRVVASLTSAGPFKTLYRYNDAWLVWPGVVHAAPAPIAEDRLYYTGDGAPKMRVGSAVYPLAVPYPSDALTATLGGTGDGDVVTRVYVYTWVTSFGEESEPSAATADVDWKPGNSVTLSGFVAAPSGRGITLQRIYRTQTGTAGTDLYFIAERAATTADFVDTVPVDGFQEPLPSRSWNAPPDDMRGLITMPNGMMAAHTDREIFFCEPYHPHAWPEKYALLTDVDIVGLGAIGSTLVILTKGMPYTASGAVPEAMQMQKVEINLPCINPRGIVDLGFAIAYPSHEGLVVVRGDGSAAIVSGNLFSRDDWLALSPSTMTAAQISGRYFASYRSADENGQTLAGAMLVDVSGNSSFLIRSDARADAAFYEVETGGLYYIARDTVNVRRFDPPDGVRAKQYWKSKLFVLPFATNFGAIRVEASSAVTPAEVAAYNLALADAIAARALDIEANRIAGAINEHAINAVAIGGDFLSPLPAVVATTCDVGVYADGAKVAVISALNKICRLPGGFTARKWEIDVYGDILVEQIVMTTTVSELVGTA